MRMHSSAACMGGFALLLCSLVSPAMAQNPPAGTVGIYFDTDYTQTDLFDPPTFVQVKFWVVASDLTDVGPAPQLSGYEVQLDVPPELTVTGKVMNPITSINIGDAVSNEWIVGTGACLPPDLNGNVQILEYQFLLLDVIGQNRIISFGPTDPSSFNPPAPGWLECGEELYTFAQTVNGRINPVTCDVEDASFDGTMVRGLDGGGGEVFATDVGKPVNGVLLNDLDEDGENNVLYWTASDGVAPGTVGQLNCQGEVVWDFTESGLTCQPTDGLVDVTALEIGDFYEDNLGDEILVVAHDNAANDVPVLRLNLIGLDGTLLGPSNNFEYWVLGDMPIYEVLQEGPGQADVVVAGQDTATGIALVMRLPMSNLRGAGPHPQTGCTTGTEDAVTVWGYVLGGSNGTIDPYFQQESMVSSLVYDTGVFTITMDSANVYEVDDNLLPLPCELVTLTVAGDLVTGKDGADQDIWTYQIPDGANAIFDTVLDVNGSPVAVIGIENVGSFANRVLALECHGKPASFYDGQVENCFGDAETASLESVETGPVGSAVESRFYTRYLYPSAGNTRLSVLSLGNNVRTMNSLGDYDVPGEITVMIFGDGDGDAVENLYLGFNNVVAGGFAHVLAFDALAVSGSAAPGTGSCGAGSELWSALFNGGTHPADMGDVTAIALTPPPPAKKIGVVDVTTTVDAYQLDATTGDLLGPNCSIDPLTLDFGGVEVGQTATLDFTITNSGTEQLAGTVTETCDHFQILGDATYDLAPQGGKLVIVEFAPTIDGNHQCLIDTGDDLCADVNVTGSGFVIGNVALTIGTLTDVAAGSEVTLSVDGTALAGVAGLDGRILYDGAAFSYVGAELGELLATSGGFSGEFNGAVAGEVSFAIARATGLDAGENEGAVMDITFLVSEDAMPGTYAVSFESVNVFDENAVPLDVLPVDGSIEVLCRLFDVTGDGEIHSNDAVKTLRIDVGIETGTPQELCAADVDGDGEVTSGDAVAILRYIVGLPIFEKTGDLSKGSLATLIVDGSPRALDDGTVAIPLAIDSSVRVAGADLSFALSTDAVYTGMSLRNGSGAFVTHVEGNVITLAAAAAEGLGDDGTARFELRVRPQAGSREVTLTLLEGRVFDTSSRPLDLDNDGALALALDDIVSSSPTRTALYQNHPNPFNPRTEIRFHLAEPGRVQLSVYDVSGRRIAELASGHREVGDHSVTWHGIDDSGRTVASGVYIYRLEAAGVSESKRMILVR